MKRPLALVLGITGNMAFAAACLLRALRRHSPDIEADILVYTDGTLAKSDETLLRGMGATLSAYSPPPASLGRKEIETFSLLTLARFECLRLLQEYCRAIWLDVDIAIQGDIGALASSGPLAVCREDSRTEENEASLAGGNTRRPIPGLNPEERNCNAGVLVFDDRLPSHQSLYQFCIDSLVANAPDLLYPDQAIINILVQRLRKIEPGLVQFLDAETFNCHPYNPRSKYALITHMFGPLKTWNDALLRLAFPEWERDYAAWLRLGGSPWNGTVHNAEYADASAFSVLKHLFVQAHKDRMALEESQKECDAERILRERLEKMLAEK